MKNLIVLSVITSISFLIGCAREEIKGPNKPLIEKDENFNSENLNFGQYDCPYDSKELHSILSNQNQVKATWPKIKVTATFGGFTENSPCSGCENCGCCFGLCIQISSNSLMTNDTLTQDEINNKRVLFDFIDRPEYDEIILIANNNVDNGDGYLHIEDNSTFSSSVCNYIGREVTLAMGSYEIVYSEQYPNGIIVVRTL